MRSMKNYQHFSDKERELIFLYYRQGKIKQEIGRLLARNYRTIGRQLLRNSGSEKKGGEQYPPFIGRALADQRRTDSKIALRKLADPALKRWVIKAVESGDNYWELKTEGS